MPKEFFLRQRFLKDHFNIELDYNQKIIALAGNPNVGKSTIFNALTGLHQHTGNWPGKTVDSAQGTFSFQEQNFLLIDLPGTYSILAHTAEEEVARQFLCFGNPDATLVVVDASCLERNLNLVLQVMELSPKVLVCVNLLDEAEKKGITVNLKVLSKELNVPVIGTTARSGKGIDKIKENLLGLIDGTIISQPKQITYSPEVENSIAQLISLLSSLNLPYRKKRWLAMRILEGEIGILDSINTEARSWIEK